MKRKIIFFAFIITCNILRSQDNEMIPEDFGIKASIHVKFLCGLGKRTAGSVAEQRTIEYLSGKFRQNDMNVKIDTFRYRYYNLNNRTFFINNKKISLKTAYINHLLKDTISFESSCVKFENISNEDSLLNKVVLTTSSKNSIKLTKYRPKAIFVVEPNIYDTLKVYANKQYTFKLIGSLTSKWITSYNIIAKFNKMLPVDSTIVITAHWDSDPGIGAGDNASGTAALIELSNFFRNRLSALKYNLVFLITGAHEHDGIGITSYVINHYGSINKYKVNVNIDDISCLKPYIERSYIRQPTFYTDTLQKLSVVTLGDSLKNLLTSFREIYGNHQENSVSIKWLRGKFEKSMKELSVDFQDAGCCSGSDSNMFDYVGIPYIFFTSINTNGQDNANTLNDLYNDSFIPNIQLNGKIIGKIILDLNK